MKAFGLSNDICSEFLRKMSTIADLSEGMLAYELHLLEICLLQFYELLYPHTAPPCINKVSLPFLLPLPLSTFSHL